MDIDWTSLVIKFNNELLYVINIFKVFLLSSLFDICEGWGGGGLTVIQVVLIGIPFTMSPFFIIRGSVSKSLGKMMRHFLWEEADEWRVAFRLLGDALEALGSRQVGCW